MKWVRFALYTVKGLFIFFVVASAISNLNYGLKNYGEQAPKSPLYGVYEIERFFPIKNEGLKDSAQWKTVIFNRKEFAAVRLENDSLEGYSAKIDTSKKTILLISSDSTKRFMGTYLRLKNKGLQFKFKLSKDSLSFITTRKNKNDFRLTGRGFHWINEYPYNR